MRRSSILDVRGWVGAIVPSSPQLAAKRSVAIHGSQEIRRELGGTPAVSLPQGVITFLVTDVEGSSRLWEADPVAMRAAITVHDELLERSVAAAAGVRPTEQGEGDSAVVAFSEASRALSCALELQRRLARRRVAGWRGASGARRPAQRRGAAARPPQLRRARRLTAARGCGRSPTAARRCVSRATYELVVESLPEGAGLRAAGPAAPARPGARRARLRAPPPELRTGFPPPRSLDALPNNLPVQLTSFIGRERRAGRGRAPARRPSPRHPDRRRGLRQDPARRSRPPPRSSIASPTASGGSSSRPWPTSGWSARRSPRRSGSARCRG